jgi:hypothetical protein
MNTAMNCEKPDRVPVWCLLSLEHIVNYGTQDGEIPETIEELVEAKCRLVKDYRFDGTLVYFPGLRKETRVFELVKKAIKSLQISSPYAGSSLISVNSYRDLVLNSVKVIAQAITSVKGKSSCQDFPICLKQVNR